MRAVAICAALLFLGFCSGEPTEPNDEYQKKMYPPYRGYTDFGERYNKLGQGAEDNFVLKEDAKERVYYIAAVKVDWDYAPKKENTFNNDMSTAKCYIENGKAQIGSVYTKVIYKRFTDDTYTQEIPSPPSQGYVGPLISGEVGDRIIVHFKNMGDHPHTIHPFTNVFYGDSYEGALFRDDTTIEEKEDDQVPPGGTYTYVWELREDYGPMPGEDICIPVLYHSHFRAYYDINSGLVGMMLVCKKGHLRDDGTRKDVDKSFVLYIDQTNEGASRMIEENLNRCGDPDKCKYLFSCGDEEFLDKLKIFHINGYIYGNGPDFEVCSGEKAVFYTFALNEGVYSVTVYGQIQSYLNRRFEAVGIPSGIAKNIVLTPEAEGRYLIGNTNLFSFNSGMFGFVDVKQCDGIKPKVTIPTGRVRKYYIAAEEVEHSHTPHGIVARAGRRSKKREMREREFLKVGKVRHGQFVGYTDKSFRKPLDIPVHMADLGPPISAEVGDLVIVYLKNRMKKRCASFVPVGLDITKENEGIKYRSDPNDETLSGKVAKPGEMVVYKFIVPDSNRPNDELGLDCYSSYYHSAGEGWVEDVYYGLTGPLTICDRDGLNDKTDVPVGFTKQFFLQALMIDPRFDGEPDHKQGYRFSLRKDPYSLYGKDRSGKPYKKEDPLTQFPTINGHQYGNIEGIEMCLGETVKFSLIGLSCDVDRLQTLIFEGNGVNSLGKTVDYVTMWPGEAVSVTMKADNLGTWIIKSGNVNYQEDGMLVTYTVKDCGNRGFLPPRSLLPGGQIRKYYIAAVMIKWNYAENTYHPVTEEDMRDPKVDGHLYVTEGKGKFIGTCYYKAVYRQFTDRSFKKMIRRRFEDIHLGLLGPLIHAEVHDEIEIVYKNMVGFPNTISLRNVYGDNHMVMEQNEEGAEPGETVTYRWYVPERSGPSTLEPNCVARSYESTTNPVMDLNAGLYGILVICRQGSLDKRGQRLHKNEREFGVNMQIWDENLSHFAKYNTKKFAPRRKDMKDADFVESNRMYAVNGYIYFNTPGLNMTTGEHINWYIAASGGNQGQNTHKFHGQPVIISEYGVRQRTSVVSSEAGSYKTAEMFATHASVWMYRSQQTRHMFNGMMASFTIADGSQGYAYPG